MTKPITNLSKQALTEKALTTMMSNILHKYNKDRLYAAQTTEKALTTTMNNISYEYNGSRLYATQACEIPLDEMPAWWREAVEFVASIRSVPWFKTLGKPDPAWRVFKTQTAAQKAANAVVLDAEGYTAQTINWTTAETALWAATRAAGRKAARDAAQNAVWGTVWDASWTRADYAWSAAESAAASAVLMLLVHLTADLAVDEKHRVHARARWGVWQRGYGLLCDVDGVRYVYRKPE